MQFSGKKALVASLLAFAGGVFTGPYLPFNNKADDNNETLHNCATARNFDPMGLSAAKACIRTTGDKTAVEVDFRTPSTAGSVFDYSVYFETKADLATVANFTGSLVDIFAKFGGPTPIGLCGDAKDKPATEKLNDAISLALLKSGIAESVIYGPGPRHSEIVYNACNVPKKP